MAARTRRAATAAASVVADSARAWSADGGDTGALVLHGFTGNPTAVRPLAEHLAGEGFAVELPRLPGHGTSWRDLAATTWHDLAAEVDAALDRLLARCARVGVIGLSGGGALALHATLERPDDVAALVLINPWMTFRHPLEPLLGVVRRVVPTFPGVGNDIAKPGQDELPYDRVPLAAAASMFELQDRVRPRLHEITTPLLVCTSRVDHTVDPEDSGIILRGVRSQRAEQVWLERSFHVATLDYDADLVATRASGFLRSVTEASDTELADDTP